MRITTRTNPFPFRNGWQYISIGQMYGKDEFVISLDRKSKSDDRIRLKLWDRIYPYIQMDTAMFEKIQEDARECGRKIVCEKCGAPVYDRDDSKDSARIFRRCALCGTENPLIPFVEYCLDRYGKKEGGAK